MGHFFHIRRKFVLKDARRKFVFKRLGGLILPWLRLIFGHFFGPYGMADMNMKMMLPALLFICPVFICPVLAAQKVASTVEPVRSADVVYVPPLDSPAFPFGEGPVLRIDQAHRNFHTADGTYRPFAAFMARDGFRVERGLARLSAESLKSCNILVIADAQPPAKLGDPATFQPGEAAALRNWVEDGGALLLITDHMPDPPAIQPLAKTFGVEFHNGYAFGGRVAGGRQALVFKRSTNALASHPITIGGKSKQRVDHVATFLGCAFKPGPNFTSLLTFEKGSHSFAPEQLYVFKPETKRIAIAGWSQGAVACIGKGRVAIFGEAAMFTAQELKNGQVKFGMNHSAASQNARFLLNLVHWLVDCDDGSPDDNALHRERLRHQ